MSFCFGFRRPESGFTLGISMLGVGSADPEPRFSPEVKTLIRHKCAAGQKAVLTPFLNKRFSLSID